LSLYKPNLHNVNTAPNTWLMYIKFVFQIYGLRWLSHILCFSRWWLQFDWSFARLTAPVVTTTSIILGSNKIQNVNILVPANSGPPGKWLLKWGERIYFSSQMETYYSVCDFDNSNIWYVTVDCEKGHLVCRNSNQQSTEVLLWEIFGLCALKWNDLWQIRPVEQKPIVVILPLIVNI